MKFNVGDRVVHVRSGKKGTVEEGINASDVLSVKFTTTEDMIREAEGLLEAMSDLVTTKIIPEFDPEADKALYSSGPLPEPVCCVRFDDGYYDLLGGEPYTSPDEYEWIFSTSTDPRQEYGEHWNEVAE